MLTTSLRNKLSWFLAPLYGAIFVVLLVIGLNAEYAYVYKGRLFPGIQVDHILVGGLSPSDTETRLNEAIDEFKNYGYVVKAGDTKIAISETTAPQNDPDLARDLTSYNVSAISDALYNIGRSQSYYGNLTRRLNALMYGITVTVNAHLDKTRFIATLRSNFDSLQSAPHDARVEFFNNTYTIIPEDTHGFTWDYERAYSEALANAQSIQKKPITLEQSPHTARITHTDFERHATELDTLAHHGPVTLVYKDKQWIVPASIWDGWLTIRDNTLTISQDQIGAYLDSFKKDIEMEPRQSRFVLENGKATEFSPAQDGVSIDVASTATAAREILFSATTSTSTITIATIIQPAPSTPNADTHGIRELLGIGYSNFKGSPVNRMHNIAVGAAAVNGTIIQPNEEFSLLKTLGTIDASTGYRTELVIKGDKTTPEFGGGLCQIGTTMFRATMAAGMPVTERQNHSYQVSYYAENGVPGTDATIYEPKPDYRFINDSGNPILIQSKIVGTQLSFEFWGTGDGRKANRTIPKVWNIVDPPPAQLIESEDLKPGEKKCTELAHKGADAAFTYTITYANGDKKDEVFKSHYRPWQEVCLIGKAKDATTPADSATGNSAEEIKIVP